MLELKDELGEMDPVEWIEFWDWFEKVRPGVQVGAMALRPPLGWP